MYPAFADSFWSKLEVTFNLRDVSLGWVARVGGGPRPACNGSWPVSLLSAWAAWLERTRLTTSLLFNPRSSSFVIITSVPPMANIMLSMKIATNYGAPTIW